MILDKCSVMGIFIRKCQVEYAAMPFSRLTDIRKAYDMYIHHLSGDSEFLNGKSDDMNDWVSDYNVSEFLKHLAEKIERKKDMMQS